jgi:hypothetical protein
VIDLLGPIKPARGGDTYACPAPGQAFAGRAAALRVLDG